MPHGFELFWVTQKQQISHPPYLFESLISVAHHLAYPAQATLWGRGTFLTVTSRWDLGLGRGCYWLASGGEKAGVLLNTYNAQNNFSQQRIIQLKMSTVSEKPQFTGGKQT